MFPEKASLPYGSGVQYFARLGKWEIGQAFLWWEGVEEKTDFQDQDRGRYLTHHPIGTKILLAEGDF